MYFSYSNQLWKLVLSHLKNAWQIFKSWSELMVYLHAPILKSKAILRGLTTQKTDFYLWKERNSRTYNGYPRSHSALFMHVEICIKDILLARKRKKNFSNLLSLRFTHN